MLISYENLVLDQDSSFYLINLNTLITWAQLYNPLTLMSDQNRLSPYNNNQVSDENKEKCQFGDN